MKIKRYVVKDMKEAMNVIRRDLGPDAFIIGSRRVKTGGWLNFLRSPLLEVTAAVDDLNAEQKEQSVQAAPREELLMREMSEVKSLLKRVTLGAKSEGEENEKLVEWKELLQEMEVNSAVMDLLLEEIASNEGFEQNEEYYEVLVSRIAGILAPQEAQEKKECNIYALVGPTGVGKTTTLAKLAARHSLFNKQDVGLVTMDTYRIGAVDQIKTYGEIIGIPVHVAMTPEEFRDTLNDLWSRKDIVLVDTAGRPPQSTMGLAELRRYLEIGAPLEVFLVLSCTTRNKDLMRAIEEFKELNYTRLIFTKLDETRSLGPIVNISYETQVPVAYVTNGQNVPEDIVAVKPQELAKMILGAVG